MMKSILFSKYEGTGNDFILLDNLQGSYDFLSVALVKRLCDRKFGIGADGLILINSDQSSDFYMDYYNADGSKSFCGNGSRCAVLFALSLGIHTGKTIFNAIDGLHKASVSGGMVAIQMNDVNDIKFHQDDYLLDTGSPHYVVFNDDLSSEHTVLKGKEIRFSELFKKDGVNVNLMRVIDSNQIEISTYERGVEDETYSCGTGATACALVHDYVADGKHTTIQVLVKGGELSVSFQRGIKGQYSNIVLTGPAKFVFFGEFLI